MEKKKDLLIGIYWWRFLSIVSIINIMYITNYYFTTNLPPNKLYLVSCVMIYTYVCAIRAIFPRKDVDSICFYNSIISYPLIGRVLATIAEISLIVVVSNVFKELSLKINNNTNELFYNLLIGLIVIAQIFCWSGCITKCNLFNAIEESIWAFTAFCILISNIILYNNTNNLEFKKLLINSIIFGAIYIIFMIYIDIPGYYSKWKNKKKYYTISDGLISMYSCKKSQLYSIWKSDMLWLTGYFTLCVWGSIYLVKWYENNL